MESSEFHQGENTLPSRRKLRTHRLELYVSWMLGALLLLISNGTLFKKLDASIGEPWLNLFLSAVVLVLLVRIAVAFIRIQQEVREANSRIDRVDELEEPDFAAYLMGVYRSGGWSMEAEPAPLFPPEEGKSGWCFRMSDGAQRTAVVCQPGRRKLTKDYVSAAAARAPGDEAGERAVWIVTNSSFTSQAEKEASKLRVKLVDRKALIRLLAASGTPTLETQDTPTRRTLAE